MKIKIYDDGKGKFMSFAATIDVLEPVGYGATEFEALESLGHQIRYLISNLAKIDTTDEDNVVHVDYKGDIL